MFPKNDENNTRGDMMDIKLTIQKINNYLNSLPQTIKNSPKDEQIAYYTIFAGIALVVVGIFIKMIF